MIKIYNKRMDLSVKSSIAVLMNIGMRKRTYILMLSLMSFMMAFSQKDTRGGIVTCSESSIHYRAV